MKIRPFTESDTEQLVDVFKMNVPAFFAPHEVNEYEDYLKQNGSTYFVLEKDTDIVGGVGYVIKGTEGNITWIFVHPSYAHLGIGKQAVEHCLSRLTSMEGVINLVVRTSQFAFAFF